MFDLMKNDVELAKEAVKKGLISEAQLEEALKAKEKEGAARSVITIMIEKGVISNKAVKDIITSLKGKTVGEEDESYEDIEFGEEAAKKGYITYTQLWEAIENRLKTNQRIEQVLHKGGTLSLDDALDVLESQGKKIMKCPECQSQYTVKDFVEGKEYTCLKCGAPLQLPEKIETLSTEGTAYDTKTHIKKIDDMFIGKRVGSCQIIEKLGEGGMGVVFKAKHLALNKDVAVKILSPALMGEMHKKRFLREARAAAKIEHPNIVTVYDAGEFEGGYSYIVMQFIDGESLSKKIEREQRVDQLTALRIIRDAAKALSTAHKQGMIHRDIKPDNIMLTKAGEVKVADFGLVKSADVEKDLSLSKSLLMGTPHYMAPEQFEGKPADPRVDIYALGVTFFELVTGKKPFDGKTAFKIMEAHLRQEPPKPESLSKEISPEVSKIILKMLEKEPEKRYQSADELIKDLDRVEGLLTGVKPAGEKKVPITAMVVVVVIVAAAIVGYFVYDNYRREKEEEARKVALENEAKTELDKLMTVVDELVAKNQFDTAFERLNSYPQQYQPTLSYSLWVSKRSDVLGRFKDYLSSQIASIAKDKDEKPEETVAVAEPVLRVAESVSRIIKGNEEIDKLRAQFGEIYKSLSETVTKAKDSYSSIERQMDEMRSNGDFERAKELLLPFVSSKVTSVRKSAQEQTKEFDRLIADAVRDFESAITRAEVKESKGDYEAAIKEIEKYKESKINSIKRKANEELGRLTQLKAGKENEQRLRESFDKQMRDVERMLEGGKGEAAADLCKELMKTPFTDLAQKAKEKLLYVKERMYKNMVYVAEGSFVMGSDEKSDNNPVRKVELKGFFIDRYEVTNAEYAEFVKATNRKPPEQWKGSEPPKGTENLPVVGVTLEDAKAYAAWCGKRLPTEEEWEKAASWDSVRGVKFRYPWGNEFSGDNANIGDKPGVVAVGSFVNDVSPYGVFDMAGNVAEFTSTMRSGKVVVRGASFKNITLTRARTSYSGYTVDPAKPFPDVGFRCARDDRW